MKCLWKHLWLYHLLNNPIESFIHPVLINFYLSFRRRTYNHLLKGRIHYILLFRGRIYLLLLLRRRILCLSLSVYTLPSSLQVKLDVITVHAANGWNKNHPQSEISLSTTEAEYIALSQATRDNIPCKPSLKNFLLSLS